MQHPIKFNMNPTTFLAVSAVAVSFAVAAASPVRIDVAAGESPTAVRDRVRAMSAAERSQGVEVVFADGEYRLSGPVRLDARDGSNVTWRAANRGKAVFNGAMALSWRKLDDEKIKALLPPDARDNVLAADVPGIGPLPTFYGGSHTGSSKRKQGLHLELFSGTNRLCCARWPDEGFARTTTDGETNETGRLTGYFGCGDMPILAALEKEPFAWTFGLWKYEWADLMTDITSVDVPGRRLAIDPETPFRGISKNMPFYIFNAFCALNRPGEWVADLERRRVYLWPLDGAPEAEAVLSEGLMRLDRVDGFSIDGIVFEKTRLTALETTASKNVKVTASTFRHTGSWAVRLNGGSDCRVAGCDMYDLGEGGVYANGGDQKTLTPSGHVIDNCHIHHYGRVRYNYRQGIALHGTGCRALHNLVHHSDHTGIYSEGNDQYIGYNVVHDTCLFNDDAGAIYTWQYSWFKRGGTIECNVIHHSGKPGRTYARVAGIYIDDYGSDATVRWNIVNYAKTGIALCGGCDNLAYGNVLMNCLASICLASRNGWPDSKNGRNSKMIKELENNFSTISSPVWQARYPGVMKTYEMATNDPVRAHFGWRNAVVCNTAFHCVDWPRWVWDTVGPYTAWKGNETIEGEPHFADFKNLDWRVQPGSPAYDAIRACRFEDAGLYASDERASPPIKFSPDATKADWLGFPKN